MNTVIIFRNTRLTRDRFYRFDIRDLIEQGEPEVCPDDLIQVAIAEVGDLEGMRALERAYYLTNTTDQPWWSNDEITLSLEGFSLEPEEMTVSAIGQHFEGQELQGSDIFRSTEIGDVMICNGKHWIVATCGFREISPALAIGSY